MTTEQLINDSIATKERVKTLIPQIELAAKRMADALKHGKKLLICGNGGSAADAQHFAAEFIVRFDHDRKALPAIALTTDTSTLTAGGNDYGFDAIFERQVEALGEKGDVLIGITTSGNSPNILRAFAAAKKKGVVTICLNGKDGGKVKDVDENVIVPSNETARIQESHLMIYHIWCKLIDEQLGL